MRVVKRSDELRFNKEEIDILKEAKKLINEVYENLHDDGNIDGWYENDFESVDEVLNTLIAHGNYINGEYCLDIDYD